MGRKILLLISGFGMAAAMAILGTSFILSSNEFCQNNNINNTSDYLLQNNTDNSFSEDHQFQSKSTSIFILYLPLVGMCLFFFAYAIGFNSVILILLGELYAPGITFK